MSVLIVALGFATTALVAVAPATQADSFCALCAARNSRVSWTIRGTNLILFETRRVSVTPISELFSHKSLVPAHQHQWLPPRTVPNPLDPSGAPVVESLEFINAPRVVNFLRDLSDFGDPEAIANWRDIAMRPEFSYVIDPALRFCRAPADGFGERQKFLAWWQASAFPLYQRLREQTEAD